MDEGMDGILQILKEKEEGRSPRERTNEEVAIAESGAGVASVSKGPVKIDEGESSEKADSE